jgi:hypothetical protein
VRVGVNDERVRRRAIARTEVDLVLGEPSIDRTTEPHVLKPVPVIELASAAVCAVAEGELVAG